MDIGFVCADEMARVAGGIVGVWLRNGSIRSFELVVNECDSLGFLSLELGDFKPQLQTQEPQTIALIRHQLKVAYKTIYGREREREGEGEGEREGGGRVMWFVTTG